MLFVKRSVRGSVPFSFLVLFILFVITAAVHAEAAGGDVMNIFLAEYGHGLNRLGYTASSLGFETRLRDHFLTFNGAAKIEGQNTLVVYSSDYMNLDLAGGPSFRFADMAPGMFLSLDAFAGVRNSLSIRNIGSTYSDVYKFSVLVSPALSLNWNWFYAALREQAVLYSDGFWLESTLKAECVFQEHIVVGASFYYILAFLNTGYNAGNYGGTGWIGWTFGR